MQQVGDVPEVIAETVLKAATAAAPRRRYAAGKKARQTSFEAAAVRYRLYCRAPKGLHLTETSKHLGRIATPHKSYLDSLKFTTIGMPWMVPADLTLLNHIASAENNDEDSVVQATKSIAPG